MAQLRQDHDQYIAQDTTVLVVGPEDAQAFAKYWQEHRLPFIGLPDPEHTVLDRYGQEFSLLKFGRQPAQVCIDKNGQVRFAHYGDNPTDIPSNKEILELLQGLNSEVITAN